MTDTPQQNGTSLTVQPPQSTAVQLMDPQGGIFGSVQGFEIGQRMARAFASSDLVPTAYRGNVANCMIVLDIAQRMKLSPLLCAQNLNIIHGRPSWGSSFIISAINSCGRFAPLRFEMTGIEGEDSRGCVAWTTEKGQADRLTGPQVTIRMAKAEGWWSRKDQQGRETSKWQTMSELMIRYRAAAFFGRLYAPELLNGMHTTEEVEDIQPVDVTPTGPTAQPLHVEPVAEIETRARASRARRKSANRTDAEPPAGDPAPEPDQDTPPETDATAGDEDRATQGLF